MTPAGAQQLIVQTFALKVRARPVPQGCLRTTRTVTTRNMCFRPVAVSVKNNCQYAVEVAVVANPQASAGVPQWRTPGAPADQPSFKYAHLEPGAEFAVDFAPIDASSCTGVSMAAQATPSDDGSHQCMVWGDKATDPIFNVEANCNQAVYTYVDFTAVDLWSSYLVDGNTTCGCYNWGSVRAQHNCWCSCTL